MMENPANNPEISLGIGQTKDSKKIDNQVIKAAKDYLYFDFSVLPVNHLTKKPVIEAWKEYETNPMSEVVADKFFAKAKAIGLICGKVSGSVECLDFEAKKGVGKQRCDENWNKFLSDDGVKHILSRYNLYAQTTKSGGYHLVYRYDSEGMTEGSKSLAYTQDNDLMIETRGEGNYFCVHPSPGYTPLFGSLQDLSIITFDEREYLLNHAKSYNEKKFDTGNVIEENKVKFDNTDPVSWYNFFQADYSKWLLKKAGWTYDKDKEQWTRPGKDSKEGGSAKWDYRHNHFYIWSTAGEIAPFEHECYYSAFQILVKLQFKGNFSAALNWIIHKYFVEEIPFLRIGTNYFKVISKPDRYGNTMQELKVWKKDEIRQDYNSNFIDKIPKFDDFVIVPCNKNYQPTQNNNYNLYGEFIHTPDKGDITWSTILMEHVFGEQIDLGWRYMKLIYEHPQRIAPVLVLVSKERETGKTTFLNWLNMIFVNNVAMITPDELTGMFNSNYATKNLIIIEETLLEKAISVEKLKALSTQKFITINEKHVSQYKVPFFGKFILASNNEDTFAKVDQHEIRFFVRKLNKPTNENHNIEAELLREIPAFLYHLEHNVPSIDFTIGRVPFTPDELNNSALKRVKENSKNWLYKELLEILESFFNEHEKIVEIYATPKDIKDKWFANNPNAQISYIRKVLKDDFNLEPQGQMRYPTIGHLENDNFISERPNGRPFIISRQLIFGLLNIELPENESELPF